MVKKKNREHNLTIGDTFKRGVYLKEDKNKRLISSYNVEKGKSLPYISPIKNNHPQISLFHDCMFKTMFTNSKRIKYPAKLFSYIIDMRYEDILKNIKFYKNEFDKDVFKSIGQRGDHISKLDKTFLIIECNNNCNLSRNLDYMDKLSSKDVRSGTAYNYYPVIEVNLNNYYREGTGIYDVNYRTNQNGTIVLYKVSLDIHVPLIYEKMYNKGVEALSELERYLVVLTTIDDKLAARLAKGDEIMEEYVDEARVVKFSDPELVEAFDHIKDMVDGAVLAERAIKDEVIEKKDEELKSMNKKHEESRIKSAKNMFKDGLPLEKIIDYLSLSAKELEKLKLLL